MAKKKRGKITEEMRERRQEIKDKYIASGAEVKEVQKGDGVVKKPKVPNQPEKDKAYRECRAGLAKLRRPQGVE